jgi:excisionase family DNA binding protein
MMDTREVAAYLRLGERRVYDLVRKNALPHIRATGKLLFPKVQIDAWLASKSGAPRPTTGARSSPATIRCWNGQCAIHGAVSR